MKPREAKINLNPPDQLEIKHLWEKEVEKRVAETEHGETELIPGEQVFSEIRQKYSQQSSIRQSQ